MAAPRLALSVFVLMLAAVTLSEGIYVSGPKKCCYRFNANPPIGRVVGYVKMSEQCPIPALLLNTEAGHQLCVRPSVPWVKDLISALGPEMVPETANL